MPGEMSEQVEIAGARDRRMWSFEKWSPMGSQSTDLSSPRRDVRGGRGGFELVGSFRRRSAPHRTPTHNRYPFILFRGYIDEPSRQIVN